MAPRSSRARKPAVRAPRADGDLTRQHILRTAGQVFAERGYADTTSKEICTRAGTNVAAVNYHFGGKDGLYEAVLIEAHRQIVGLEDLAGLAGDPRQRLRALLLHLLQHGARPAAPWGFRVILRELMAPSPLAPALVEQAILPKARLVRGLVAGIMGLPAEHPAVQRCLAFTVLPCIMLVIAPKEVGGQVLPALKDTQALVDELMRYAFAGIEAVAAVHRPSR